MTKGSDLLVAALENEGVERIFGVPGEENLDVVESLRTSKIKLILTRHEQAAAFMAAAHGRLTGTPRACISTPGPARAPQPSKTSLARAGQGQAAAFMAATHGRLTGTPGVCISTLGPGALNLSTGAAYAHLGAMPMILITGQKAIMSSRQARLPD